MNIRELEKLLRKCWKKETSADPNGWTFKNPMWGQCAVTALVVQDFFGGELMRASLENVDGFQFMGSHYWNRLPNGKEIDLTRSQFPKDIYGKIPEGEPRTRTRILSYSPTLKRFAKLRLDIQKNIDGNGLYLSPTYQECFETAQFSGCKKMRYGCIVMCNGKVLVKTPNKTLEPLKHLCETECIRLKIKSRTHSMIGSCSHAEEEALWETVKRGAPLHECSFYIAGFGPDNTPWIKQRPEHTCLRCSTQMYMAGVGKIFVPVVDMWVPISARKALETATPYALSALPQRKTWHLNILNRYFALIKNGRKIVEGRAPSPTLDYTDMKPGDMLIFANVETDEELTVTVDKVLHYPTVQEMLRTERLENCLPGTKTVIEGIALINSIADYKQRIQKGGIYAIRFHL